MAKRGEVGWHFERMFRRGKDTNAKARLSYMPVGSKKSLKVFKAKMTVTSASTPAPSPKRLRSCYRAHGISANPGTR